MSEEIENPRKYVCIHERRLNKNENRITELEAKASFKEERIHELKISMDEMDKKLDNDYNKIRQTNEKLLSSKSWKITEPLRKIKRIIK